MPLGKHAGQRIKENLAVAVAYGEAIRFQLLQEGAPDRPFIAGDDLQTMCYFTLPTRPML